MIPGNEKKNPEIPLDVEDTDETREPTGEDLRFNEDEDSFELEPETEDTEYQHPEPYDTAAPGGEDDNSTYDEENPYTPNEYRDKASDLKDELAATVANEQLVQLDEIDERLADTPEDSRRDLDEEGYPMKDNAGGDQHPIVDDPDTYDDGPEEDEDEDEKELPPGEDPQRDDDEPIDDDPGRPIAPEDAPPIYEPDPLGDRQFGSDGRAEDRG